MNIVRQDCPCVLIVDDDESIRETFRFLIESAGYSVVTASNGLEALEHLYKNLDPCLIFLDLMMPVMDGWEVARELASDSKFSSIPTVIITAIPGEFNCGDRSLEVLRKPIDGNYILKLVERNCLKQA